jgi:hypothetical protein
MSESIAQKHYEAYRHHKLKRLRGDHNPEWAELSDEEKSDWVAVANVRHVHHQHHHHNIAKELIPPTNGGDLNEAQSHYHADAEGIAEEQLSESDVLDEGVEVFNQHTHHYYPIPEAPAA